MNLEYKLSHLLKVNNKTLCIAESCSGGIFSHRLTNIPGCSKFFKGAVIAYSNEIKSSVLKVPKILLNQCGAVSKPVALKMAENIRKLFKTDIAIAITGIAGPGGGSVNKPVGLVFIAISISDKTTCIQCRLKGSRLQIKQQAVNMALKTLLKIYQN